MELPVRILFITPYPELKQQLAAIIPHYPARKDHDRRRRPGAGTDPGPKAPPPGV